MGNTVGGMCKTGAEHLDALRDGRAVYIDGERVADVTVHPGFRNAVHSAAALYDFQCRPENIELMTFVPAGGKRRINRCWQMPHDHEELVQRRKALVAWAVLPHWGMFLRLQAFASPGVLPLPH